MYFQNEYSAKVFYKTLSDIDVRMNKKSMRSLCKQSHTYADISQPWLISEGGKRKRWKIRNWNVQTLRESKQYFHTGRCWFFQVDRQSSALLPLSTASYINSTYKRIFTLLISIAAVYSKEANIYVWHKCLPVQSWSIRWRIWVLKLWVKKSFYFFAEYFAVKQKPYTYKVLKDKLKKSSPWFYLPMWKSKGTVLPCTCRASLIPLH